MTALDLLLTSQLMQACQAAYELDASTRAKLLSAASLAEYQYVTGLKDARALVCRTLDGSRKILAFQGTQFSKGELPSIMSNVKAWPASISDGRQVDSGYWEQVLSVAGKLPDLSDITHITGHSMGGCMAHLYTNTHDAPANVVLMTYGAPKCADSAFWKAAKHLPIRITHARDFAPVWPYLPDEWEQPGEQWWFHDGTYEANLNRPVMPDSIPDHMPPAYQAAIDAVAA